MKLSLKFLKSINKFFPKFTYKYINNIDGKYFVSLIQNSSKNEIDFLVSKLDMCNFEKLVADWNVFDIKNFLLKLSSNTRKLFLREDYFRNRLLSDTSCFRHFIYNLSGQELLEFIDTQFFHCILDSSNALEIVNEIINLDNYEKNYLLSDDKCILFLSSNFINNSYKINDVFAYSVFDYAFNNNDKHCLNLLRLVDDSFLDNIINADIYEKLVMMKVGSDFLFNMSNNCINKLIRHKYFYDIFINNLNKVIEIIDKRDYIFPNFIIQNDSIINYFVNISDCNMYRKYVNKLKSNNFEIFCLIEERRRSFVKDKFKDIEKIDYNNLLELVVDTYFKDFTRNFLYNLKMLTNYVCDNDLSLIPSNRLDLYKNILCLNKLSLFSKVDFISSFSDDTDYAFLFYDDYNKCLKHSYEEINKCLLKLNKDSKLYNKTKSLKYGVDVYELNGEPFYSLAHCTGVGKNESMIAEWKPLKHDTASLSLFGDKNISLFNEENVFFGFSFFDTNGIMHVSNTDSFTTGKYGTGKIRCIYSPSDLLLNSVGYTEILYKNSVGGLSIDYIGCYDEVGEGVLVNAKEYNVPILIVNSKKYDKKYGNEMLKNFYANSDDYSLYLNNYDDILGDNSKTK